MLSRLANGRWPRRGLLVLAILLGLALARPHYLVAGALLIIVLIVIALLVGALLRLLR